MLNRVQDKVKGPAGPHVEPGTQEISYSADDKFLHLELTKKINLERRKLAQGRAKNSEVSKAIIKECAKKIGEMEAKYAMKHAEKFQEWQYVQWMLGKPVLEDQNWKQRVGGDLNRIDNLKQTPGFKERAYTIIDNYYDFRKFMAHLVFNGPLDDKQAYAYWKYIINTGLKDSLVKADGEFNTDNYDNFLEYILLNFGLSSDELAEAFGYKPKDPTKDAGDWNLNETLQSGGGQKRVTLFDRMASRQIDPRYETGAAKEATQEAYEDYYKEHVQGMTARMHEENEWNENTPDDTTTDFMSNVLSNAGFQQYIPRDKYENLYTHLEALGKSMEEMSSKIQNLQSVSKTSTSGAQPATQASTSTSVAPQTPSSSSALQQQKAQYDAQIKQLNTMIAGLNKDLADQNQLYKTTTAQLQSDINDAKQKEANLKNSINQMDAYIKQVESKATTDVSQLQTQLSASIQEVLLLKQQQAALQQLQTQTANDLLTTQHLAHNAMQGFHDRIAELEKDKQNLQSQLKTQSSLQSPKVAPAASTSKTSTPVPSRSSSPMQISTMPPIDTSQMRMPSPMYTPPDSPSNVSSITNTPLPTSQLPAQNVSASFSSPVPQLNTKSATQVEQELGMNGQLPLNQNLKGKLLSFSDLENIFQNDTTQWSQMPSSYPADFTNLTKDQQNEYFRVVNSPAGQTLMDKDFVLDSNYKNLSRPMQQMLDSAKQALEAFQNSHQNDTNEEWKFISNVGENIIQSVSKIPDEQIKDYILDRTTKTQQNSNYQNTDLFTVTLLTTAMLSHFKTHQDMQFKNFGAIEKYILAIQSRNYKAVKILKDVAASERTNSNKQQTLTYARNLQHAMKFLDTQFYGSIDQINQNMSF